MVTYNTTDDLFGVTSYIVDPTPGKGNYQTIGAALTVASSASFTGTIFIRPGTYNENPTLVPGVNLSSWITDGYTGDVTINGNCTLSSAGTVTISGIRLQTNSSYCVTVSGSAASILNLVNCNINCLNSTGIYYTCSNSSSILSIFNCMGNLATNGIAIFSNSSAGNLVIENSYFTNSGLSTTSNTCSGFPCNINYSLISNAITTSGTGGVGSIGSQFQTSAINLSCITALGTGGHNLNGCLVSSGTATAIGIGNATTFVLGLCTLLSSNASVVSGAGVLQYTAIGQGVTPGALSAATSTGLVLNVGMLRGSSLSFDGGSNVMSDYTVGTFTPTVVGQTSAGTTTYTVQNGYYVRIGAFVQVQATVQASAATGTGNVLFGGFPFTIKNQTNGFPYGSILDASSLTWPTGATSISIQGMPNTSTANAYCSGSTVAGGAEQISNTALNFQYTIVHEI